MPIYLCLLPLNVSFCQGRGLVFNRMMPETAEDMNENQCAVMLENGHRKVQENTPKEHANTLGRAFKENIQGNEPRLTRML